MKYRVLNCGDRFEVFGMKKGNFPRIASL